MIRIKSLIIISLIFCIYPGFPQLIPKTHGWVLMFLVFHHNTDDPGECYRAPLVRLSNHNLGVGLKESWSILNLLRRIY